MKKKSDTLANRIYNYIKKAIIKNEIKPNQKIPEKKIASLFNSSITPVREAILRLAAEGFIEMSPNRSPVVKETTIEDYLELQEALLLLDNYACTLAMREITQKDTQRLRDMTIEMGKYCNKDSIDKYLEINYKIHQLIFSFVKNKYLYPLLIRLWDEYKKNFHKVLQSQYFIHSEYFNRFYKLHKELLKSIETKDISLMKNIIKKHWVMFP